jgi:hypothetical protein
MKATAHNQALNSLTARASDSKAVLFDIRSAKNELTGKAKLAFRDSIYNPTARILVSKRAPLALAWVMDAITATFTVTLLQGTDEIQACQDQLAKV